MKSMLRMLLGLAMITALIATTGTAPLAAPAAAAPSAVFFKAPKAGQTSAAVKALQRRLVKAGVLKSKYVTSYYGPLTTKAVKAFQRRQDLPETGRVTKATWTKLVAATKTAAPTKRRIDKRCKVQSRALCVDKTTRKLYYLKAGVVVRTYDARFGCAGMRTREGKFTVLWKSRRHVSSLYGSSMPYAMFFSGGQAVHYSPDFAENGYSACSHGCVNIRNKSGIHWVFDRMRVGDRVVVYRS